MGQLHGATRSGQPARVQTSCVRCANLAEVICEPAASVTPLRQLTTIRRLRLVIMRAAFLPSPRGVAQEDGMRALRSSMLLSVAMTSPAFAQALKCDMTEYKESPGLTAAVDQDVLVVTWTAQGTSELRARFAIDRNQPVVRDLAVRKAGGQWATLGQNLAPEYHVVSGLRRMSSDHVGSIPAAGIELTPAVVAKNRWFAVHDAPLEIPGERGRQMPPLPRKPEEIRRADATFNTTGCSVKTDGARLEVNFPGLSMGIFAGSLRFTSYRGTNLIRMDAIATTDAQFAAYKYDAGLKAFSTYLLPP